MLGCTVGDVWAAVADHRLTVDDDDLVTVASVRSLICAGGIRPDTRHAADRVTMEAGPRERS